MPVESELFQKLSNLGATSMSPIELLAVAIVNDEKDADAAIPIARELLQYAGGIRGLPNAAPKMFEDHAGLSSFRLCQFFALLELGRRTVEAGRGDRVTIGGPEDVYRQFLHLRDERKEHFCSLLLDAKNKVIKSQVVHIGTVSASVVGVKEFYKEAVREGAAAIIAVHNHPSGDPTPSPEDFEVTRVLSEAGRILEIPLLDHVIVGEADFRSMQRLGAI
jgi:DNA repair protein RadC